MERMALLTAIVAAGVFYECWEHAFPYRNEYTIETPDGISGLKILFISDFHCNSYLCWNSGFFKKLRKENPDVILLAGDIVNKYGKPQNHNVRVFLKQLSEIAPVIASMGNHEEKLRLFHPEEFHWYQKELQKNNIVLLKDEILPLTIHGKTIDFYGYTPDIFHHKGVKIEKKKETQEPTDFHCLNPEHTILLGHDPDLFPRYQKKAALSLAGHIHGGLIRFPYFGGVLSPNLTVPKYTKGVYEENGRKMLVSVGLGSHSLPSRINNRVEYCIIHTKSVSERD